MTDPAGSRAPKVSIVTVNLDNAAGLRYTRDSITKQTARDEIEWVVVDGASRDASVAVARGASPYVRTSISSEPDAGIYAAMNRGWVRARGELVVFLNSGDCFSDDRVVERTLARWERGGWRWGYGCLRRLDVNRVAIAATSFAPFRLDRLALGLATVPHQATFMERALLAELGGFDLDFKVAADQELLLRAALTEAPATWIDFLVDFEAGGVGSSRRPGIHLRDMRHASAKSGLTLYGSRAAHRVAAAGAHAAATVSRWQSALRRRRSGGW